MKQKLSKFIESNDFNPKLVAFTSGLYPFLHYYNSNLSIADSWQQLLFLLIVCFLLPQILLVISPFIIKRLKLQFLEKYRLIQLNLGVFVSLLIVLILHYNKWYSLILFISSVVAGFLFYKHLTKIVILQFILTIMSFVMLIPKLYFSFNQNNESWAKIPDSMLEIKLQQKPNIFVIQPDGYANISELNKAPYNYNNSKFENWLDDNDFSNYPNFRSNYYSTLTSNASMFAMKHHYYANTNKSTLKTHKANNVIVGDENNVLKILKSNKYKTHLVTDNSFFLINRTTLFYDFCNVPKSKISYYDTGGFNDIDIIIDLKQILDTTTHLEENFFFIEKTLPSHIIYEKSLSKGAKQERIKYIERLELANEWLEELVLTIKKFDNDAMVIIVADHGGFVGLDYTLEVLNRKLDSIETISCFSSMLSIKWPREVNHESIKFGSSINLFNNVFYSLSNASILLDNLNSNSSFIPLNANLGADFYECIDDSGKVVFNKVSNSF